MARISVEQKALTDSRFTQLGLHLCPEGMAQSGYFLHALGLGAMIFVWNDCQERSKHSLHYLDIEALGLQLGLTHGRFPEAIVRSELGVWAKKKTHVRIKGTVGRIEWLEKRRDDGKKGGRPRKTLPFREIGPGNNPPTPTPTPTPTERTKNPPTPRKRGNGYVSPAALEELGRYEELSGWPANGSAGRSVQRLLDSGKGPDLVRAREAYAVELEQKDSPREFRIRPHNWFGREARWEPYSRSMVVAEATRPEPFVNRKLTPEEKAARVRI